MSKRIELIKEVSHYLDNSGAFPIEKIEGEADKESYEILKEYLKKGTLYYKYWDLIIGWWDCYIMLKDWKIIISVKDEVETARLEIDKDRKIKGEIWRRNDYKEGDKQDIHIRLINNLINKAIERREIKESQDEYIKEMVKKLNKKYASK